MTYRTVIGLEIHVQLKTKSKMFCGCDNKADEAQPNTLVCPVCSGMPGVLPVANKQAIEWVIKTGLALNCQIADFSRFDRKHYFYPDLPKNYQISQYDKPFCIEGNIDIETTDAPKNIRIKRVHLEEDAGKLIHQYGAKPGTVGKISGPGYLDSTGAHGGLRMENVEESSLVDFNRAGTPLMEIVTEPDIASPAEAKIFMQKMRSILRDLDVSDADMEKGHLRCDANISIEADGKEGIPVEIKNMNSFRMVEAALAFEEKRQTELLKKGEEILKETRGWNDAETVTVSQRSKEFAEDYRYFPEPDLPPFMSHEAFEIEKMEEEIAKLLADKQKEIDTEAEEQKKVITLIKNEKGYNSNLHDIWVKTIMAEPIVKVKK